MSKLGTIVVIDDNRGVLTALLLLLKIHFTKVVTLSSPITLPTVLCEEVPDVILLDMNFTSGINNGNEGFFWLREIKKLHSTLPVVLFTAYADIDLAVRGIKEGAADFIVKPWDNRKLVETLQAVISVPDKGKCTPSERTLPAAVTPITSSSDTLLSLTNNESSAPTCNEEIRHGLQTISLTSKGLFSFVESYRRFTHIPTPEPTLFYVQAFIDRMVKLSRHQYNCTHIRFSIHITPTNLILHADENLIAQVVINLLKNAIQAVDTQPDADIIIHAYCNGLEEVLIEIKNSGPTIPTDIAEHIFIPFFTTKMKGSGIGLSISRQIMRLSGGALTLLPGRETTFRLTFK